MAIPRRIDPHDHHDAFEGPKRRRQRRAPKGRQNVTQLIGDDGLAQPGTALRRLQERGFVQSIVGELKSGKEATVYLGESPVGPIAVKIYRDLEVRSFKDDRRYQEGRFIGDARLAKAIRLRSGRGLRALKALWAAHEALVAWRLYEAGVSVPEPLIGPDAHDLAEAGEVVVMRFVGDPEQPAPRLADATLTPAEAEDAHRQCLHAMRAMWRLGLVHGDFSAYNLLWWQGRVVVIDFPQTVLREWPGAEAILAQDAASLAVSLKRLGIETDPAAIVAFVTADDA